MPRPLYECAACEQDFASLDMFDRHLVGDRQAGVYRGPLWDWETARGLRCLTVEEMIERGWERNRRGRWHDPRRAERARRRFREKAPLALRGRRRTRRIGGG